MVSKPTRFLFYALLNTHTPQHVSRNAPTQGEIMNISNPEESTGGKLGGWGLETEVGAAALNGGAPTHQHVAANFWSEAIKKADCIMRTSPLAMAVCPFLMRS